VAAKQSKSAVRYSEGMPRAHCGICAHFQRPRGCELVAGRISPEAWCRLFTERRKD
jgi:hypothetical protein